MKLNVPDTRQGELARRLLAGTQIVAADVAEEFAVSVDTIRRDILALEADGKALRVRGGALPVSTPAAPIHDRIADNPAPNQVLIDAAVREIGGAQTLLVDGGTTLLAVIEHLPPLEDRLVITPSPWIAITCQRKGIAVFLLGGTLRPQGGIATGETTITGVAGTAADIAILGACGIEVSFGLSSDNHDEAIMKRAMHNAAARTFVVTDFSKIGLRARHHTLPLSKIDLLITDVSDCTAKSLADAGTKVVAR